MQLHIRPQVTTPTHGTHPYGRITGRPQVSSRRNTEYTSHPNSHATKGCVSTHGMRCSLRSLGHIVPRCLPFVHSTHGLSMKYHTMRVRIHFFVTFRRYFMMTFRDTRFFKVEMLHFYVFCLFTIHSQVNFCTVFVNVFTM